MMAAPEVIFDVLDEDAEAKAIAQAEAEIDAGMGVPHAQVREWLLSLVIIPAIPR
jgi:predicted transcriptional regulator